MYGNGDTSQDPMNLPQGAWPQGSRIGMRRPAGNIQRCSRCGREKSVDQFRQEGKYQRKQCKECVSEYEKSYRLRVNSTNEGRVHRKTIKRNYRLRRKYCITVEQYQGLIEKCHGRCEICGSFPGEKPLSIDHNHETGLVRGLLCDSCNNGLGCFKDNRDFLKSADKYLEDRGEGIFI